MINLSIKRFDLAKNYTYGVFYEDDSMQGFTIEDEVRNLKIKGLTAIPFGKYSLETRFSPKFSHRFYWNSKLNKLLFFKDYNALPKAQKADYVPHELFWIKNVPSFEYILIHWGNTANDTDGCIIIGDKMGKINNTPAVINSIRFYKDFYERQFPKFEHGKSFITIYK